MIVGEGWPTERWEEAYKAHAQWVLDHPDLLAEKEMPSPQLPPPVGDAYRKAASQRFVALRRAYGEIEEISTDIPTTPIPPETVPIPEDPINGKPERTSRTTSKPRKYRRRLGSLSIVQEGDTAADFSSHNLGQFPPVSQA